jgi:N-6 DNA Methylase/TaqI-like C-terminal specificity domain
MNAPNEIIDLVNRFEQHYEDYKSSVYKEAQLRQDFINPFFRALGWDVDNIQGNAEAYREVIHEDAVRIGGGVKAPDYSFRIGSERKFFVESKKPSVVIKDEPEPAFQVRRYAWSAKLPLSILTNFEEFAVYDCRIKPAKDDPASRARVFYDTFRNYAEKWDWIISIFSKGAILKGSFDKYAEQNKAKRGTAEVDEDFLATIEIWRDELARNMALRNPKLGQREINFAVQRIIDRVIFLRISEDRGIEHYGRLLGLTRGQHVYRRMCDRFHEADGRYNSGLFHFKAEAGRKEAPDGLTLHIDLDDKLLRHMLEGLYYPESPYEFSVISADILGQVYEQFLGKVIRLTAGHRAVVEDKPEVKKAGGVYYTPTYIVDYIVRETVGKLVEGKRPADVAKLRILDPACGSGSFLIGTYQFLLSWHLDWYSKNEPEKWARGRRQALVQTMYGWRLSIAERKRILLDNIYGVDIDPQAVEVTRLSLLLKVLEGETEQTLQPMLYGLRERALPDLGDNIKCGNSLIGQDFYDQQEMLMLDEDEQYRINVFEWQAEFSRIIKASGFDAVVGNPPWGATFSGAELAYLRKHYSRVVARMIDSYIYFIDRAIQLTKENGPVGFIIPSTVLNQVDAKPVRKLLLGRGVTHLISLGQGVFGRKVLNTSSILVSSHPGKQSQFALGDLSGIAVSERPTALRRCRSTTPWMEWKESVATDPDVTFSVGEVGATVLLATLRKRHGTLRDALKDGIQRGVSPDIVAAHVISKADAKVANLEKELLRPSVSGAQIKRYQDWRSDQLIIYTSKDIRIAKYPFIAKHLEEFRHLNSCKEVEQGKHPYWALHRPRDPETFRSPKFIGLTTSKTIELIYDENASLFVTDAMYVFSAREEIDPWALMAVLQSKLFLFIYRVSNQGESRVIPQVKAAKLELLPLPKWQLRARVISTLSELSQKMLQLHKQRDGAWTPQQQKSLERQITSLDAQIDALVYEMYGLTSAQIELVHA